VTAAIQRNEGYPSPLQSLTTGGVYPVRNDTLSGGCGVCWTFPIKIITAIYNCAFGVFRGAAHFFYRFVHCCSAEALEQEFAPLQGRLAFPTALEVQVMNLEQLHQIWRANNEILIGLLQTQRIPNFGFHGTTEEGLTGIQETRAARGCIYVAGVLTHLDPISTMADIYTAASKAQQYGGAGGLFIVKTARAQWVKGIAHHGHHKPSHQELSLDSALDKRFLSLVWRSQDENVAGFTLNDRIVRPEGNFYPSASAHFAAELFLGIDPENYAETVLGILPNGEARYPQAVLSSIYRAEGWSSRLSLVERMRVQEIVVKAFEALGVIRGQSPGEWERLQTLGRGLLGRIDEVTLVPARQAYGEGRSWTRLVEFLQCDEFHPVADALR